MELYTKMKEELTRMLPHKECCITAELSALIKTDGVISISGRRLSLNITDYNAGVARKIVNMLKQVGDPQTQVSVSKRHNLRKGNLYTIRIPGDFEARTLMHRTGILDDHSDLIRVVPEEFMQRKCCKRAYLRGVFLGAGYLGKPEHGYHVEITVPERQYGESIIELLESLGMKAHIIDRKDRWVVYMKASEDVVELMKLLGATNAALDFENTRIVRSIRNDVNRLVNADSANAAKSVEASIKQIQDIQYIKERVMLSKLALPLREIINLRMENPEASLVELGQMTDPPISKSGVNHRMRRIAKLAEELRAEEEERGITK